jgi:hypothetical protein
LILGKTSVPKPARLLEADFTPHFIIVHFVDQEDLSACGPSLRLLPVRVARTGVFLGHSLRGTSMNPETRSPILCPGSNIAKVSVSHPPSTFSPPIVKKASFGFPLGSYSRIY